ncbi:retrotransposon unclassified [Hordeum vulgare]|nr:retrotransposon unclassified [Hordeum vulgare]
MAHANEYYKELFGPARGDMFHLSSDTWSTEEKLSVEDNNLLTSKFTEEEVKKPLFSMDSDRAHGPDNIPAEFYKHCWDFVKNDMIKLFEAFHNNSLDVARLNYGVITLLPKLNGPKKIQQYRPIFLLWFPYKLITKVLNDRVAIYSDILTSRHQNAYTKRRNMMDGILTLPEVLHHTQRRKKVGIVLKLDFEKAYDKIN